MAVQFASMTAPVQSDKARLQTLDKIGTLVPVLAALVGVIGALGLPAISMQYCRLKVPLQLITNQQALRAGILPAISLFVFVYATYLFLKYKAARKLRKSAFSTVKACLRVGFRWLFSFAVVVFILSWPSGYLSTLIGKEGAQNPVLIGFLVGILLVSWFIIARIPSVGRTLCAFYSYKESIENTDHTVFLVLAAAVWAFLRFAVLPIGGFAMPKLNPRFHFGQTSDLTFFDSLLSAIAFGLFGAALVLWSESIDRITPSQSIDNRRRGKVAGGLAALLTYIAFVTIYSSDYYPVIPYWIGGGRPTSVRLWLKVKEIPKTANEILSATFIEDGDTLRCEAFLVYIDSDIAVVANSDGPQASSLVLRRDTVVALNSPQEPGLSRKFHNLLHRLWSILTSSRLPGAPGSRSLKRGQVSNLEDCVEQLPPLCVSGEPESEWTARDREQKACGGVPRIFPRPG